MIEQASTSANVKTDRKMAQPVDVMRVSDALLKIQTVSAVTGLSAPTIYRKVASGSFPNPVRDGRRCTRWVAGDVTAWLRSKAVAA